MSDVLFSVWKIWSEVLLRNHFGTSLHRQPVSLKGPLCFPHPKTRSLSQRNKLLTGLEPYRRISRHSPVPFPTSSDSLPRATLAACPDPSLLLKFRPTLFFKPDWTQGHLPFLDFWYKLSRLLSACPPGHCLAWCPVYVKSKRQDIGIYLFPLN